jgi:hypothetical protein
VNWFINTIPHEKEPGLLGKMADSWAEQKKYKMRLEHLVGPESKELCKRC